MGDPGPMLRSLWRALDCFCLTILLRCPPFSVMKMRLHSTRNSLNTDLKEYY